MSATPRSTSNSGIQANSVTADVMAVGNRAQASKTVYAGVSGQELAGFVTELRNSISELPLQPPAKKAIQEDLTKLDAAAGSEKPQPQEVGGLLNSIAGKLSMVGVVVKDVVTIAEPIRKIIDLFGLQLPW